ncbi:MAG: OmpA family protein [Bacteroidales bacterium]|jgi:outer membrane protein OmpA-like peptidoglycan-associated protein|nr:OmpA family protein [Bacteroidales bacterium]
MKKNILLSLLIFFTVQVMSQEKGSYLTLSCGVGPTGFKYKMTGVVFADPKSEIKLGGQAGIGYSYYFTKNVGISIGIGFSHYRTNGKLMGAFSEQHPLILGKFTDNDIDPNHVSDYELRVRTQNWIESQSCKFVEIPITLNLQKKFGEKEQFGLYMAVGAKLQFPFSAKYSIVDGRNPDQPKLNISGYYEEKNLELGGLGDPDLAQHGFGKIHNPSKVLTNANGKLDLKMNLAFTAEGGFLISLSRRVDLTLGVFVDCGLLNIRKTKESLPLFSAPETDYVSMAENYNVGRGITYNSITKSEYVNKVNTISYGGKAGLRIKLGKLSAKEEQPQHSQEQQPVYITQPKDTVFINVYDKPPVDSILKDIIKVLEQAPKQKQEVIIHQTTQSEEEHHLDYYPDVYPDNEIYLLFDPIYFDLNKSALRPESINNLNKKIELMNKYPEIKLIIFGNTCDIGKDVYNFKLGYQRAEVARDYLVSKGIAADRLQISTQAQFDPELPNINEINRTHNRRDDFKPIFPKR